MNGFAPLIEGFLAFALTMLALTTGVSSIVGALNHLRRRHARGLRDMVRVLYLRDLVPLVDGTTEPGVGALANALAPGTPAPQARATADDQMSEPQRNELARRTLFIFDMTFMPVPDVVEKIQKNGRLHWLTQLASAEKLVGTPWYTTLFHPRRLARRWKTLRCGLAELTDAEFLDRLARSDLGSTVKGTSPLPGGFASWEALSAHLLQRFKTIGGASSETFARHARGWSVVVGLLLAVGLNIDSIDLLNSYLTNPELRQQVLDQTERIVSQEAPSAADQSSTTAARAEATLNALSAKAKELEGSVQALASGLPTDSSSQKAAESVKAGLQSLLSEVPNVKAGVTDVARAERQIRGVARSLTTSFPIGWARFPTCNTPDSPDLRCADGPFTLGDDIPVWYRVLSGLGGWLPQSVRRSPGQQLRTVAATNAKSPAQFYQWFAGVLLTTVLLGLGSPFWVQVVSSALNLSRAARGNASTTTEQAAAPARAQAPAGAAPPNQQAPPIQQASPNPPPGP
jgi:hypothetical protein